MRSSLRFLVVPLIFAGMSGVVRGQQTAFPFQLLVTSPNNSAIVANGGTITFLAEVGQTQTAHVLATYRGNGQVLVSQDTELFGSTSFSVKLSGPRALQPLPYTLTPGDSIALDIIFKPASTLQVSAQLIQPYLETVPSSTGLQNIQSSMNLTLVGTAPAFAFSYVLQADQNVTVVPPGGTMTFLPTLINTTAQATLNITNTGSGPGQIKNVALLSGSPAFKLQALPLFPVTLTASQTLTMLVLYTPSGVATDTGQIEITYGSGTTAKINLLGSGTASSFTYQVLQGSTRTPLTPGGTLTLPDTPVGSTNSIIVQVQNTGNANGVVNSVSLAGQGFQLSGLPAVPPTLKPNDSFSFSINFTPIQPGTNKGQLVIGSDVFSLAGQGLGPQLAYSYVSQAGTINLGTNGSVVFSPIQVGQSEQVTFVVNNSGTSPATISNVGIGETKSPFKVTGVPALPLSLDPGGSFQFDVIYTPTTTGFVNGTIRVDTTSIGVTGSGTPPPALPSYTLQGPNGTVAPLTQSRVSLSFADAYPLALAGTLTLTTSGTLPSDPAVQFSTGGRTVPFVIPANSKNANFAGQGSQIFLQSGSNAESITLTPSFLTQDGGLDLTPSSPTTLQFSVAPAAPTLLAVQVVNQTTNSFVLNVTGYSTTRSLTTLNVTFTPASGFNLTTIQLSVDVRSVSNVWFQSATSLGFGGQFTISVPFTLQGTVSASQTLLQSLAAVSATVSNDSGTSNSMQARLQ